MGEGGACSKGLLELSLKNSSMAKNCALCPLNISNSNFSVGDRGDGICSRSFIVGRTLGRNTDLVFFRVSSADLLNTITPNLIDASLKMSSEASVASVEL